MSKINKYIIATDVELSQKDLEKLIAIIPFKENKYIGEYIYLNGGKNENRKSKK